MSKKALVYTWGCSHNQKDSQLLEYILVDKGYTILKSGSNTEKVDIIVLNTCTVKAPTENKILHIMNKYRDTDSKVIVTGCIAQIESFKLQNQFPNFVFLGVNGVKQFRDILDNSSMISLPILGNKMNFSKVELKDDYIDKSTLNSVLWNRNIYISQINEGCLNRCTFCSTKFARGRLQSFPLQTIVSSIRETMTPEVWITSQDTACWGFDMGTNLASLMQQIVAIPRKFWIRIGMGNPNNMIKILDDMIEVYKSEKIFKFLHLPIQSGNNRILKHMKRGYTISDVKLIISTFKTQFPDITISTDVICGYPIETEEEFDDTIELIRFIRPNITNISRYWEREGTEAAKLPQLPHSERKRRSKILAQIVKQIQFEDNKRWVGWKGEILLSEIGDKGGLQGRNINYKPVIVDLPISMLGSWVNVEITDFTETYFIGKLIRK
ncbi:MAG: tRNA (N(6)-L-threonylcarbamoyladenosine(37)-C(2))-methylthiotransferase [Candidatus Heimdallarchaeota archaeon]|nr:tRNA (N(6)-L-threonylcarbamoyladenosine(37)-C(2))-methylthiotransferase [Candidatus Heimdallarchaeota archaeon]